ncbi:MAG: hypothetical protein QNJ94_14165 [Alphaproteobacteria bacterium]|nr:hypothetical protein [Alphaproteobacteria bacterium]
MRLGDSPMDYVVVANAVPMPTDPPASEDRDFSLWDGGEFDFGDILDAINPLQHIPIVSTIYREITGDEIGPAPRIAGGALFGGLIGAAVSLFNVIIEDGTGKDIGEHAVAMLFDGDDEAPPPTAIADANSSENTPAVVPSAVALASPTPYTPIEQPASAVPPLPPQQPTSAKPLPNPAVVGVPTEPSIAAARPSAPPAADQRPRISASNAESPDSNPHAVQRPAPLPPGPWIADSMLNALDQYRRMMSDRNGASPAVDLHT